MRQQLEDARRKGAGSLGQANALNALKLAAQWRTVEDVFQDEDIARIDDECAALAPALNKLDRTWCLTWALRAGYRKTIDASISPPDHLDVADWILVDPSGPGRQPLRPGLLNIAIRRGEWGVYQRLLDAGADLAALDWSNWSALHELARAKRADELEKLLAAPRIGRTLWRKINLPGGSDGESPLQCIFSQPCAEAEVHDAAEKTAAVLIQAGADVTHVSRFGRTALHEAAKGGFGRVVARMARRAPAALLATNKEGQTLLHMAAFYGNAGALNALRTSTKEVRAVLPELVKKPDDGFDVGGERTALHAAARCGQVAALKQLIDMEAPLDAGDFEGATPLMRACWSGQLASIDALIYHMQAKNLDPFASDKMGRTVLHHAALAGDRQALASLLGRGAKGILNVPDEAGRTPLVSALAAASEDWGRREGALACARLLLARGADVELRDLDGHSAMAWAAGQGAIDIMETLRKKAPSLVQAQSHIKRQPIHEAAEHGSVGALGKLIEWGADIGAPGSDENTPFHVAAFSGRLDCLERLIEAAGERPHLVDVLNRHKETALHSAADADSMACAQALIRTGAEPDPANHHGRTPLARAARNGSIQLMQLLLDKEADVDRVDEDGQSPLSEAIKSNNADAVLMLIPHASLETLTRADTRYGSTLLHLLALRNRTMSEEDRLIVAQAILMRVVRLCGPGSDVVLKFLNAPDSRGRSVRFLARGACLTDFDKWLAQNGAKLRASPVEVARQAVAEASSALKTRPRLVQAGAAFGSLVFNALIILALLYLLFAGAGTSDAMEDSD